MQFKSRMFVKMSLMSVLSNLYKARRNNFVMCISASEAKFHLYENVKLALCQF